MGCDSGSLCCDQRAFDWNARFRDDIAMVRLYHPIEQSSRILRLCKELVPYLPVRQRLGTCGRGTVSQKLFILPDFLQETFFYQSTMISDSNPFNFKWCRADNICVDGAIRNTSICHYDDGAPLYTFKCGTKIPDCLYGVASYSRSKVFPVDEFCNGGSFFASVPFFYKWMLKIIAEY
ncbi:uncharacterized protein LOC142335167 isoform X1 [Convolutriloba macropyga]|uniref:uncharacterized protein LOC142335167 isoform X1 n=2 Tax=Convolutriloba macropyga TaxID=536237 RepID=UPI003F51E0CC